MEINKEGKLILIEHAPIFFKFKVNLTYQRGNGAVLLYSHVQISCLLRESPMSELWTKTMLPKLTRFYKDYILPEILDSRIIGQLRVRDPAHITDAQSRKDKANLATSAKKRKEIGGLCGNDLFDSVILVPFHYKIVFNSHLVTLAVSQNYRINKL